jgi:hypothetical protein
LCLAVIASQAHVCLATPFECKDEYDRELVYRRSRPQNKSNSHMR